MAPLDHWSDSDNNTIDIKKTRFENCFFLAALSFCETGVMRLSVGDTKLGLLVHSYWPIARRNQIRYLLCFGKFLGEESLCTHTGSLVCEIRISEWGLRHNDLGSLRGVVKRLDRSAEGRFARSSGC